MKSRISVNNSSSSRVTQNLRITKNNLLNSRFTENKISQSRITGIPLYDPLLSSIPPLSNSQTLNKHFELTRDIFRHNILPAINSYRSHLVTRGKSIIRYVGMLRNYLKTLPSTKIVKTNFPSKNTGKGLYGYLIYLLKNDPVYMLWFNFILGSNFLFFCFWVW